MKSHLKIRKNKTRFVVKSAKSFFSSVYFIIPFGYTFYYFIVPLFKLEEFLIVSKECIKVCKKFKNSKTFGSSRKNPGAGFLRIFTVTFDWVS